MQLRRLWRLTILLPVLFVGAVLFVFAWFQQDVSRGGIVLTFAAIALGTVALTTWLFQQIERREAELRSQSSQLSALREASLFLTDELELSLVLQRVVDQARVLVDAEYGALGVLDEGGTVIDQFIVSGLTPEQRARLKYLPHGDGLLGVLIKGGESIRIPDIGSDSRSVGFPPNHPDMRSLLGVPIKFKGEILGDLYMTNKRMPSGGLSIFSERDQLLLEMFASHAAIAIKNAQNYRQSQQLTLFEERERIGMDLHDGIIQSIYAVGLMLEDAQFHPDGETRKTTITQAIDGLNSVILDIRSYILDLRPQRFQGRDLVDGLEELAREVRAHSFLDIDIQVETRDWERFSPEQTVAILHIAREGLTNVRKHARANRVIIKLIRRSDGLALTISDNGNGFSPDKISETEGNGLRNMRERALALGGGVEISKPGTGGTRLTLSIPMDS